MARSPFLVEIRPDREVKEYLREIIDDIQRTFGVHGMASGHVVPHVTLFGPFNADGYGPVLSGMRTVLESYTVVPYRIEGFDHFRDDVIYADLATSEELRSLRRELRRELQGVTRPKNPGRETRRHHQHHMTAAFKDINRKFDEIWHYVNEHYEPFLETYAHRISFLHNRRIVNEWDLLAGEFVGPDGPTEKWSWDRTMEQLEAKKCHDDHEVLSKPHQWGLLRRRLHSIIGRSRDGSSPP